MEFTPLWSLMVRHCHQRQALKKSGYGLELTAAHVAWQLLLVVITIQPASFFRALWISLHAWPRNSSKFCDDIARASR
jgi:hypothetical protein